MRTFVVAIGLMAGSLPAVAQSIPPAGARACSGCHAPSTLGSSVPAFVGHSSADIVTAMAQFRSGERPSTVMGRIAKGFSEDEVRAIATWLAAHPDQGQ